MPCGRNRPTETTTDTLEIRVMSQDEPNYYAEPEDHPPERQYRPMGPPPASGVSIASVVCGACFCLTPIPSLLAVILGFIGIRKTRDPSVGGKGLSIAGLVMGVIGLGIWLVFGAFLYIVFQMISVELTEVRSVSHQFVQDLSEGKIDAAASHAGQSLDRKELEKSSAAMKDLGPFNEIIGEPGFIPEGNTFRWEIKGRAVFNKADKPIAMRLVKGGSTYRVESFESK